MFVGGLRRLPTRILDLSGASFIKDLGKRFLETDQMKKNRFKYIRVVRVVNENDVYLVKLYNDVNVIVLLGRFIFFEEVKRLVDIFLVIKYEGGRY